MPPAGRTEDDVLRKLGETLLALPILALAYIVLLGRGGMARFGTGVAAAVVAAVVVVAGLPPAQSNAVPVSSKPQPVDARVLDAVTTGHGLAKPFTVAFDGPMDPSTVAAALRLQPDTAVTFAWDDAGRVLTISPLSQWQADTLYVLTVSKAARAADGGALRAPVRSAVLTAQAGSGSLAATRMSGKRARPDTAFRIQLDRPVTLAVVKAAIRTEPEITGKVTAGDAAGEFLFTPQDPLTVGAAYAVSLPGLVDSDGVAFGAAPALAVQTSDAPGVVRFRPRAGGEAVGRTAAISVRFTERMDSDPTAKAFHVTVGSTELKGSISWAEQGRVLVFVPADPLPYGATVRARVDDTAVSRAGAALAKASTAKFTVEPKPKPKPKPKAAAPAKAAKPVSKPKPKTIAKPGGGGAVAGSWAGVESYYLRLMNCTRTGGWVTSGGNCSSPGGRDVAPLVLSSGISSKVSRPYAKLLATRGICNHFIGGNPGDRLRRAGYNSYRWGENLGCRSGNPSSAVLGSHLFFQSERPYNGGHYRNLMDARYKQVGIGVWVSGGRVRLVIDFYAP
jgi:uncharacterized protein YkwD